MWAIRRRNFKAVELILSKALALDLNKQLEIINAKTDYDWTPLLLAAASNTEVVEPILNYVDRAFGLNEQLEIINAKNWEGNAALDIAKIYYCNLTAQAIEDFKKQLEKKLLAQQSK